MTGVTAVQYGVGPIGSRIVETAADRGVEFVGAIDVDPRKVGRDLGEVADIGRSIGIEVTDDPDAALGAEPEIVFHSTQSSLANIVQQLNRGLHAGADIISTTEELAFPWYDNSELANELDRTAIKANGTVLGTGINPGFAMDLRPAVLTIPCRRVDRIEVTRIQDAATRRKPLQEKIGAGRTVREFEQEIATEAGHVGLPESAAMLAAAVGWELDDFEESIDPVIADERVDSKFFSVAAGEIAGIHQVGIGTIGGEERIQLDLQMYLEADNPHDRVVIEGDPGLDVTAAGGFHGDVATPAIVVNVVRRVLNADPGLKSMIDLPPGTWRDSIGG